MDVGSVIISAAIIMILMMFTVLLWSPVVLPLFFLLHSTNRGFLKLLVRLAVGRNLDLLKTRLGVLEEGSSEWRLARRVLLICYTTLFLSFLFSLAGIIGCLWCITQV